LQSAHCHAGSGSYSVANHTQSGATLEGQRHIDRHGRSQVASCFFPSLFRWFATQKLAARDVMVSRNPFLCGVIGILPFDK
jgi:hypothetical protein